MTKPRVAIVDYGMGNLFSVKHACEREGMTGEITSAANEVMEADAAILPGVGAFPEAMKNLQERGLDSALKEFVETGRPLMGICLGFQLLMTSSEEFGDHPGLNILEGRVKRFTETCPENRQQLKVPHVGWNRVMQRENSAKAMGWLERIPDEEFFYFVHSFYVEPAMASMAATVTRYGHEEFCSSIAWKNVYACQFHPERSGTVGLQIYKNLYSKVTEN